MKNLFTFGFLLLLLSLTTMSLTSTSYDTLSAKPVKGDNHHVNASGSKIHATCVLESNGKFTYNRTVSRRNSSQMKHHVKYSFKDNKGKEIYLVDGKVGHVVPYQSTKTKQIPKDITKRTTKIDIVLYLKD